MNKFDSCKHSWKLDEGVTSNYEKTKFWPAVYECEKCKTRLFASDLFQLEAINYMKGVGKWISIIALLASIIAIFVGVWIGGDLSFKNHVKEKIFDKCLQENQFSEEVSFPERVKNCVEESHL